MARYPWAKEGRHNHSQNRVFARSLDGWNVDAEGVVWENTGSLSGCCPFGAARDSAPSAPSLGYRRVESDSGCEGGVW